MARGRIIDRSVSTSRKISKISDLAALIYTWLITHTDDYGRMDGDSITIKAKVVPMRNISLEQVESCMVEIESAKLIRRYMFDEDQYLEITDFEKYQTFRADRPRRSEYPTDMQSQNKKIEKVVSESDDRFTTTPIKLMLEVYERDGEKCRYCGTEEGVFEIDHVLPKSKGGKNTKGNLVVACYSCNRKKSNKTLQEIGWELLPEPSLQPLGDNGIPTGDNGQSKLREVKGREEKLREEKNTSSPIPSVSVGDTDIPEKLVYDDDRFDFFWKEYPKKTGKGDAWKLWKKLKPGNDLARRIVMSVREHCAKDKDWKRDGGKYIPNPATFLNQRRFDDEITAGIAAVPGKFSGVGKKA